MTDHLTPAQRTARELGYVLASETPDGHAPIFEQFARAAARSNRPDADRLAAHYRARAQECRS